MAHRTEDSHVTWDEAAIEHRCLDEMVHSSRRTLDDENFPVGPGVYAIFCIDAPQYRRCEALSAGQWPIYLGTARSCSDRVHRHRIKVRKVPSLGGGDRLRVVTLELPSRAAALYGECLLIHALRPLWNQGFISGFGSMPQGRNRAHQSPSPWRVVHEPKVRGAPLAEVSPKLILRLAHEHLEGHSWALWPEVTS